MKLFLDSYGCTLNQADAEIIRGALPGYEFTDLSDANTVILNTCAVKGATQARMLSRIKKYLALGKRVIVAGCLPKVNPRLLDKFPVSIVDTNSIASLPEVVRSKKRMIIVSSAHKNKLRQPFCAGNSLTGIVPISEGCLGRCSFCGTKNARGDLTSYPIKDIVERVRFLIDGGKKEIYLTAQDTGCYGLDRKTSLCDLLEKILEINGDYRLRIGMMNPQYAKKMLDSLIGVYNDERVYKFVHIPVQSGSNKVIREMNRAYRIEEFEKIVGEFRKKVKDICISTDIIVGFPSENDSDFEKTVRLIEKVGPDIINISKFCPRPNTTAAAMKPLRTETVKKRTVRLHKLCKKISLEQNKKYIGRELTCLVIDKKRKMARAPNFKQVFLDRQADGFVKVKITGASYGHLKGETQK